MEKQTELITTPKGTFPATVVTVIDDYKIAINKGGNNGIKLGQRMLVYRLSEEEIVDPDTGESLGYLEIVKGTGRIIYIQETMSILESDNYQNDNIFMPIRLDPIKPTGGEPKDRLPFDKPKLGDRVKPI